VPLKLKKVPLRDSRAVFHHEVPVEQDRSISVSVE